MFGPRPLRPKFAPVQTSNSVDDRPSSQFLPSSISSQQSLSVPLSCCTCGSFERWWQLCCQVKNDGWASYSTRYHFLFHRQHPRRTHQVPPRPPQRETPLAERFASLSSLRYLAACCNGSGNIRSAAIDMILIYMNDNLDDLVYLMKWYVRDWMRERSRHFNKRPPSSNYSYLKLINLFEYRLFWHSWL